MIDFKVLPEALLFIAGAVPNTLFMAFVSIFFGILFGSFIAVLRLGNNMFINIFFAVFVSPVSLRPYSVLFRERK